MGFKFFQWKASQQQCSSWSVHCELFITAHLTLYFSIDLLRNFAVIYCSEQTPHATYQYARFLVKGFCLFKMLSGTPKKLEWGQNVLQEAIKYVCCLCCTPRARLKSLSRNRMLLSWDQSPSFRKPGLDMLFALSYSLPSDRRPHRPLALHFCQSQRSFFNPVLISGRWRRDTISGKDFSFFSAGQDNVWQILPENNTIYATLPTLYFQQTSYSRQHLSNKNRQLSFKKTKTEK